MCVCVCSMEMEAEDSEMVISPEVEGLAVSSPLQCLFTKAL